MSQIGGSYPHPVLGYGDDVESYVEVTNVRYGHTSYDVSIEFRIKSDDPDFWDRVDAGDFRIVAGWNCPATLGRGHLDLEVTQNHIDGHSYSASLIQELIRGQVAIRFYAVATRPLRSFAWRNQNPDYFHARFDIDTGEIIADFGVSEFEAEKQFDPLQPPLNSFLQLIPDKSVRKGFEVDYDDEVIRVRLSLKMAQGLQMFSAERDFQLSTIVLPVLVYAISEAYQEVEDPSNIWMPRLRDIVEKSGGKPERPVEAAQKILDWSTEKMIINYTNELEGD